MRLGIGFGFGIAQNASGVRLAEVVAGTTVLAAWDAADGTLSTTPFASGTSPPAVTLSGSVTPRPLRIELQTTGARGTAIFRYSADGGATWIESGVTTAATYPMIGAASGTTLNFPVGSYTNDNVYRAVYATLTDRVGGFTMAPSSAGRAPYCKLGSHGRLVAANEVSVDARSFTCSLDRPAPGTTPTFALLVFRNNVQGATAAVWCGSGNASLLIFRNAGSANLQAFNAIGSTVKSVGSTSSHYRVYSGFANAGGDALKVGALSVATGIALGNTDPPNHFDLLSDAAGSNPEVGELSEAIVCSGPPTNQAAIDSFLAAKYPSLVV